MRSRPSSGTISLAVGCSSSPSPTGALPSPPRASYERLEFLGDSVLDLWATDRLFALFPLASEGDLTWMRILLVSSPTISYLAIRQLAIQRHLRAASPSIVEAVRVSVEERAKFAWGDVGGGRLLWAFSPIKVLGDALEACIGAVFLDSGCSLPLAFALLDRLYAPVMPHMIVDPTKDWVTLLLQFVQRLTCRQLSISTQFVEDSVGVGASHVATVLWHGRGIAMAKESTRPVARQVAARVAMGELVKVVQAAKEEERDVCECVEVVRREDEERKRVRERANAGRAGSEEARVGEADGDEETVAVAA